jgi:hypothetical protein
MILLKNNDPQRDRRQENTKRKGKREIERFYNEDARMFPPFFQEK